MPRFDGRGPLGKGAMSGKGMGRCTVDDNKPTLVAGNAGPVYGRGRGGLPRGNGRGMRCRGFRNDAGELRP